MKVAWPLGVICGEETGTDGQLSPNRPYVWPAERFSPDISNACDEWVGRGWCSRTAWLVLRIWMDMSPLKKKTVILESTCNFLCFCLLSITMILQKTLTRYTEPLFLNLQGQCAWDTSPESCFIFYFFILFIFKKMAWVSFPSKLLNDDKPINLRH